MISADDLAKAQSELSQEELEAVAGGTPVQWWNAMTSMHEACHIM